MSSTTKKLRRSFRGRALVLALLLFPQLGESSTEIELLSPYRAEYAVDYSGFNAKRVITLETVGDEYVLNAITSGIRDEQFLLEVCLDQRTINIFLIGFGEHLR